ncbi:MAG: TIGR01777 family oxidoreductase [Ilumatobacteraceae bacterium]
MSADRRIVVSGASGLIGSALVASLRDRGHRVVQLVRRDLRGPDELRWDPSAGTIAAGALDGAAAVINLSGAGINDHRWTDDYKRTLVESRTRTTELLAHTIAAAEERPAVLLSGSAIGYYGDGGSEPLTEDAPPGDDFLAGLCRQWEAATGEAEAADVRTVHLRTGIVLTDRGGALKKQLPLFKLGLGGRFGDGRQWQSWISLADEIGAITHLLDADVAGAVNLVAPQPVTNREFTSVLASVLRRPAVVPIPSFGPKLLLGGELAEALLYTGQRVQPTRLEASGYRFEHPTLEVALRAILGR